VVFGGCAREELPLLREGLRLWRCGAGFVDALVAAVQRIRFAVWVLRLGFGGC
jgi:hypothetical protein